MCFVEEIESSEYFLPAKHIFIFIEKRPLKYGQFHFYEGPAWLGNTDYAEHYVPQASLGSGIGASVINASAAQRHFGPINSFAAYSDLENRTAVESIVYLWAQNFMETFPFEMSVYYEDEDFVCYCIHQNPEALYNRAIGGVGRQRYSRRAN